jgi:sugar lactone lactonase YvrE
MKKKCTQHFSRLLFKCSLVTGLVLATSSGLEAQTISTLAGNGTAGYSGDGGAGKAALLHEPYSVAVDGAGNVYVADEYNARVRKISATGVISNFAGDGLYGAFTGGVAATATSLLDPYGVCVDKDGNVYIADNDADAIYKVNTAGIITSVVGNGIECHSGDGGPATAASLNRPRGVAIDLAGNMYIADYSNDCIRKVDASGIISTYAGTTYAGYGGDGGPASAAGLLNPTGVAVDVHGNIYIADQGNIRVRKVDASGIISTIAGNGTPGPYGDGGPATAANLDVPWGVTVDAAGFVYIADQGNSRIRKIDASGTLNTVVGSAGWGYTGDGGAATAAKLGWPSGITFDAAGNMYIADYGANEVRKVGAKPGALIAAEPATTSRINVFPNPGSGLFTLDIPGISANAEIIVTDVNGNIIMNKKMNNSQGMKTQIDLNNVTPGNYMLKVISGSENYFGQVTIIKG